MFHKFYYIFHTLKSLIPINPDIPAITKSSMSSILEKSFSYSHNKRGHTTSPFPVVYPLLFYLINSPKFKVLSFYGFLIVPFNLRFASSTFKNERMIVIITSNTKGSHRYITYIILIQLAG